MMKKLLLLSFFFTVACSQEQAISDDEKTQKMLMAKAELVLLELEAPDFEGLANHVHDNFGLNFSPYSKDLSELYIRNVPKDSLRIFSTEKEVFLWGHYDGTGSPILLTPMNYYREFVYDFPYREKAEAAFISNSELMHSHRFKAVFDAYPDAILVQFFFEGTESAAYKDMRDLILVFSMIDGGWYLVGLAHNESTV